MKIVVFSLFCFLGYPSVFWAQNPLVPVIPKNYKQLVRLGERMVNDGYFADAAAHFEAAYQLKPKKTELAYQAAILYLNSREYRKAVTLFRPIIGDKQFPNIHLEYAQALQKAGDWDEAIPEFLIYLNSYTGKDREQVSERIEENIAGCSLGIRQSDSTKISNVVLEHLNENVNTQENDIAPVPFGEDVLYFTTRWNNAAKIVRSQQVGNEWTRSEQLKSLPIASTAAIGNGTFSPDGTRFYCTICQEIGKKKQKNCGIYYLKRTKDGWTAPIRLSERINQTDTEGGMTTQPFVMQKGNNELLFFASNRKGGRGGMDIWMSSRSRNDDNADFESPMNLGAIINTEGDEVTPFYDEEEQSLYFASDGRATMGGLDIFKSHGSGQRWTSPANMGVPFNSGADDWYFVKNKTQTGGFFASNRSFGMEKISSRDDDIFSFTVHDKRELLVSGRVFEKKTTSLLENVRLSLYEKRADGDSDLRLLSSIMCAEGSYQFAILPQKIYTLEVEKDGFRVATAVLSTKDSVKNGTRDFYLERYTAFVSNKILTHPTENSAETVGQKTPQTVTSVATKAHTETNNGQKTNLPNVIKITETKPQTTQETVIFKVQIVAYQSELDNVNFKKLKRVEDMGDFETETATINGKPYKRVMFSFPNYETAAAALRKIKERSLPDAFIIRYENGKRTNKSR
jgi:Tetratricopeptide repeat